LKPFSEESKLSERFSKRWDERRDEQPITERIKEAVRPPGPLKPRLDMAIRRIELQIQKLDQASERFSQRDKSIFARIVDAYTKHDMARANVFANELAEIRKMEKMIMQARLALEQIVLRLRTVSELGDVVSTLGPAVSVLRAVKTGMANIFPEAERELGLIGNLLSGIIVEAGQSTGLSINFEAANEDAQKILTEAAAVAEQRIKEKFPELPAGIPQVPLPEKSPTETS
ncbi:MAG: Snf7 family protein, partial [Candidatus Bathyarchaeia archaeon]